MTWRCQCETTSSLNVSIRDRLDHTTSKSVLRVELCAKRNLVPVFASKRVETKLELFPHPSSSKSICPADSLSKGFLSFWSIVVPTLLSYYASLNDFANGYIDRSVLDTQLNSFTEAIYHDSRRNHHICRIIHLTHKEWTN